MFVYVYLRDSFALNPSATTVYARSAFYPSPRFTLSLQSAFYTQSAFYPWSAVRSLHFTLTDNKSVHKFFPDVARNWNDDQFHWRLQWLVVLQCRSSAPFWLLQPAPNCKNCTTVLMRRSTDNYSHQVRTKFRFDEDLHVDVLPPAESSLALFRPLVVLFDNRNALISMTITRGLWS